MADKAKLSQTLLLTALYCIYMRRINFDSATVNISVFIKQRNISFHGQNDISQRAVRKVKKSWDSRPGGGGGGGEHLGIFWVGMCRPGYKIDTPF